MPIDMDLFRTLNVNDQNNYKNKLETALEAVQHDLMMVEGKLKMALSDEKTTNTDLQPILSYRMEWKQVHDQIKFDLEQVNRFMKQGLTSKLFTDAGALKIASGAVSIRGSDSQNQKIPGAKTYDEILKDRIEDEKINYLKDLDEKMKWVEEHRKVEQSKKLAQKQNSSQTSQTV
jgi:hypothetical protein